MSGASPLITVGIFGYNHERYIGGALASVLDSTHRDLEVYVVDDGSIDATASVMREFLADRPDDRVTLLADGENHGLANRLNEVVARAKGEWLGVLGGDDAYLPAGLASLVRGIEPGVDVLWGDLEVMDQHGAPAGYRRPAGTWQRPAARRYLVPGHPTADIFRYNNFVCGTSPLVRITAIREVGGYHPGARNEDLDMWLRLAPRHRFKYLGEPVARYRLVPGSTSRSELSALRDQAELLGRLRATGEYSEQGLARLLAMRWALAVGRSRGRPPLRLAAVADLAGLDRWLVLRALPRAGLDPLAGSLAAGLRRVRRSAWQSATPVPAPPVPPARAEPAKEVADGR
ncbi:MAG: glycosyltransferase family 2 protein [Candidatus Nanopelagicales bacterium]